MGLARPCSSTRYTRLDVRESAACRHCPDQGLPSCANLTSSYSPVSNEVESNGPPGGRVAARRRPSISLSLGMDRRIVMSRPCHSVVGFTCNMLSRRWLLASAAEAALAGSVTTGAEAGDRYDDQRWDDHHDRPHSRVDVDIRIGEPHPAEPRYEERPVRVWVPAIYRTVSDRRWVEPVYRTVVDRRWVEPVYRTECDRVWVPEVWETREVRYRDRGGWCIRRERVLVAPAHYETRDRRVCVSEGRWETCERRELVCGGHWENVDRQELVCEGHYETRIERVPCEPRGRDPIGVINPMLAGLGVSVHR